VTRISRVALLSGLAIGVVLGAACSSGVQGGNPTPTPCSALTPLPDFKLSTIQNAVLNPSCALPGNCHLGSNPASYNLDLTPGLTWANTVKVPAIETFRGNVLDRVNSTNANPAASYLYLKVIGTSGITGLQMPYTGAYLCSNQVAAIRSWIVAGAPNN